MIKYIFFICIIILLSSCKEDNNIDKSYTTKEDLGNALFFDKSLSKNKTQSCATCHNPNHAFIDTRKELKMTYVNQSASLGDDNISLGSRNTPTLNYTMYSPIFSIQDGLIKGGQFHDGRAKDLQAQAGQPILNPIEMNMSNKEAVIERIKENPNYLRSFKNFYGDGIFDNTDKIYNAMSESLSLFEKTKQFNAFDSKYDRYLKNEYILSVKEKRGMDLFFDTSLTNCSLCHLFSANSKSYDKEVFTNYGYFNLGTPINKKLQFQNAKDVFHPSLDTYTSDTGVLQNNSVSSDEHKGKFKVPTLRNIAVTTPYMHNGVFRDLKTVLEFYEHLRGNENFSINRETNKKWAELSYKETIDMIHIPRGVDLDDNDIESLESFLEILTDKKYEYLLKE